VTERDAMNDDPQDPQEAKQKAITIHAGQGRRKA
jgi:hypothetical protein